MDADIDRQELECCVHGYSNGGLHNWGRWKLTWQWSRLIQEVSWKYDSRAIVPVSNKAIGQNISGG